MLLMSLFILHVHGVSDHMKTYPHHTPCEKRGLIIHYVKLYSIGYMPWNMVPCQLSVMGACMS